MADDKVAASSEETVDLTDEELETFNSLLEGANPDLKEEKPEEKPEESDDKESEESEDDKSDTTDSEETEEEESEEDDSPEGLKKQRDALKKEVSRLRKAKRENPELQELRERLAVAEADLKKVNEKKVEKKESPLDRMTVEEVEDLRDQWIAQLGVGQSEENAEKIAKARGNLKIIREHLKERETQGKNQDTTEAEWIDVITNTAEEVQKVFPQMKDKNSKLFQAGAKMYFDPKRHKLYTQLGDVGHQLALFHAVLADPTLIGSKKAAKEGKKVLKDLEKNVEKSLKSGAKSSPGTKSVDVDSMSEDQTLSAFEQIKEGTFKG